MDLIKHEPTRLELLADITWEQAEEIATQLFVMDFAIQWWLGDFILIAESKWPDTYPQLLPDGYKAKSLANMRWVSDRVPKALRREELTWSHHEAVAGLEPEQQEMILEQAVAGEWTVKETREAVRGEKPPKIPKECEGCLRYRKGIKDAIFNLEDEQYEIAMEELKGMVD